MDAVTIMLGGVLLIAVLFGAAARHAITGGSNCWVDYFSPML